VAGRRGGLLIAGKGDYGWLVYWFMSGIHRDRATAHQRIGGRRHDAGLPIDSVWRSPAQHRGGDRDRTSW